jgi:hypothetical protein
MRSAAPNTTVAIATSISAFTPARPMMASTIVAIPPSASTKPPYEPTSVVAAGE